MDIPTGIVALVIAFFAGWGLLERRQRRKAEQRSKVEKTRREESQRAQGLVEGAQRRASRLEVDLTHIRDERDERLSQDVVSDQELDALDDELEKL